MKTYLRLISVILIAFPTALIAQEIVPEFEDVSKFTDFSVSGLSEEKTLSIFVAELENDLERMAKRNLLEGDVLVLRFTDIDMAGDIQPWRNRTNADIRYIESIYPPRLKFHYTLKDAAGGIVAEGEESISDLAYQMNPSASMRVGFQSFFYEITLLGDWMRRTFRERASKAKGD